MFSSCVKVMISGGCKGQSTELNWLVMGPVLFFFFVLGELKMEVSTQHPFVQYYLCFSYKGSSERNTFPENVVIFFCSNHHLSYADNRQQKLMWGIWMKYCTRVGSKIGTQTKKSPKKHPCFSLQTAKSAMNWCFVAVFSYWYWVHL